MTKEFRPESILCPIDFSDTALAALRYAVEFARCFQSRLLVIYADSLTPPPYFTSDQIDSLVKSIKKARNAAELHLKKYVQDHIGSHGNIETGIIEGDAVSAILRTADRRQAGLIVLGAHGMSGFNRMMLGSVTERILHQAGKPVLTVHARKGPSTSSAPTVAHILCPVNYSKAAFKALRHAAVVAECFDAELLALHVAEKEEGGDRLKDILCSQLSPEQQKGCKLSQMNVKGDPSEKIIETALSHDCDMIVLAARHRLFFDTTVIGKTTVHVTRHSPCPVLIVSEKD